LLGTFTTGVVFPVWSQTYTTDSPHVVVSVYNDAGLSATLLAGAESKAAKIFERAEVEVTWMNCSAPEVPPSDKGACIRFDWPSHLAMRIVPRSKRSRKEVFGIAFLSAEGTGCYSTVFLDQAMDLHAGANIDLASILGSVMAHELGHLLLGLNSHASTGIMRARWQPEDLSSVARGSLVFTTEQAELMRGKLIAAGLPKPPRSLIAARSWWGFTGALDPRARHGWPPQ
jgi:hypothetical protein